MWIKPYPVIKASSQEEIEGMRTLSRIVTALGLCMAFSVAVSAQEKSLCERLGGMSAVSAVVDSVIQKLSKDNRVNKKLVKSDTNRLVTNFKAYVGAATHCPGVKYTGRSMKKTHKNMAVTEGEFNAAVEDLVQTLDEFKVPEKEKNELLALLAPLKKDIVEKPGDKTTGTDLPAQFKPAPPLKQKAAPQKM